MKQILRSLVCEFFSPTILPSDHVFMLNPHQKIFLYCFQKTKRVNINAIGRFNSHSKKSHENKLKLLVANFWTTNSAQSPSLKPTNPEIKYQKLLCTAHQIYPQDPWILLFNIVFGWVDFRGDGKYRKENWVENLVFHCLAMRGK